MRRGQRTFRQYAGPTYLLVSDWASLDYQIRRVFRCLNFRATLKKIQHIAYTGGPKVETTLDNPRRKTPQA